MIRTGLDACIDDGFARFGGLRVGLVTHPAALCSNGKSALELFAAHSNLVTLFGPEHGLSGEAQDLIAVRGESAAGSPRVVSLYGENFASLTPTAEQLAGLDCLVIDLQDIGSRYYTFHATMLYCLQAAERVGLRVIVLDRPNPIGGAVEGPGVKAGFASFVSAADIAIRHGMTMGELALMYQTELTPSISLEIVPVEGWLRDELTPLVLPPSPNMPTLATALVYPGMCLIEGTNLSEGRGTTRPFEYVGHPKLNPNRLAERLNAEQLLGVQFLPVRFTPTFQKHVGQSCGGVFVRVTDAASFQPVRTGLAVLIACRAELGSLFRWRTECYEFVDTIPAIDLLFGSSTERTMIEANESWQTIAAAWEPAEAAFRERRGLYLLPMESSL